MLRSARDKFLKFYIDCSAVVGKNSYPTILQKVSIIYLFIYIRIYKLYDCYTYTITMVMWKKTQMIQFVIMKKKLHKLISGGKNDSINKRLKGICI